MQKLTRQALALGGLALLAASAPTANAQTLVTLTVGNTQPGFNNGTVFSASINAAGFSPNQFDLFCIDELRVVAPPNTFQYYHFTYAQAVSLIVNSPNATKLFSSMGNVANTGSDQGLRTARLLLEEYIPNAAGDNGDVQGAIWGAVGTNANLVSAAELAFLNPKLLTTAGDPSAGNNFDLLIDKEHWDQYLLTPNADLSNPTNGNPAARNQAFMARSGAFSTTVPEPSTYALVGLGLFAMFVVARRRQDLA